MLEDLEEKYQARYPERYTSGSESANEMQKYPPILFTPPGGAFMVLVRDGAPIAGAAFMQIDDRTVELKRIWTSSAHRRQGLSMRVVAELEREASRRGFTRIYLTTGPRQPEARYLYLKTGYLALFDLEADLETVGLLAFEKVIEPTLAGTRTRDQGAHPCLEAAACNPAGARSSCPDPAPPG